MKQELLYCMCAKPDIVLRLLAGGVAHGLCSLETLTGTPYLKDTYCSWGRITRSTRAPPRPNSKRHISFARIK